MKKKLPIGLSDYKKMIDGHYYYVDKTLFVDDILKYGGEVTLIPRPRRFGKTLNLSMLKYFFEKTEISHAYLFEDKKIWQLPERAALQGKFPVIFLTFKDIKEDTWKFTRRKLISAIAAEYERHSYLLDSDQLSFNQKEIYQQIVAKKAADDEYHNSLKNLSQFLYRFHTVRPIVLLDEYDSPIHAGFTYNYYSEVIQFMRGLMVGVFKDNSYLEHGIITGILRTAKEGIFSGLKFRGPHCSIAEMGPSNLEIFTVLDEPMSNKFGFTQQEIDQFLQDYDLSNINEEFKNWYNGYLMGNTKIYNPWSVLNCIKREGKFLTYWANTSDNALIRKIIAQSEAKFKDACADLIAGEIIKNIEMGDRMTLPEITQNPNSIWSLFLFSGYVTSNLQHIFEGAIYADLILPNKELRILFKQLVVDLFRENLNYTDVADLNKALQEANGVLFSTLLSKFIMQSMSYYDISADEPKMGPPSQHSEDGDKKSYHLFVLGLLVIFAEKYMVQSNRESGYGRFDIMLIPKDKTAIGLVIEFKKMDATENMSECADRALEQIKNRNYAALLQQHDIKKIVGFGIAIHKKEVLLKQQEL